MNIRRFLSKVKQTIMFPYKVYERNQYGYLDKTAVIGKHVTVFNKKNLFMYEDTNIYVGTIMNTRAKVIFKKKSGAAIGLTVITGNHLIPVGIWRKDIDDNLKNQLDPNCNYDKDVIIGEDAWLGANVTVLSGVHIDRGAVIGAGSVVRGYIPPYAIAIGNPAKVIGFCFSPEEIIEHERKLFPEEERLPLTLLEKNYQKYYQSKLKEIVKYLKN